jgi:ATP-binding cassette, subfamily F, member 3
VTRFRAGTRARQAQSRSKKLEKTRKLQAAPRDGKSLGFTFAAPQRSGRVVLELENAALRAGDKELLNGAEMWLERGEHVSLVGPNGAGKTTLIETLAGRRDLEQGKLRRGHNTEIGYLSQHAEELASDGTVLEACQRATKLTPNKARALLGRFLFSGEEAEKPVAGLSGGERRRLSLAILVQSGANVLILDEPTNHLDIESREALEDALRSFGGTVLLVSHDRALLDAVGNRTIAVEERGLRSYDGGWTEYVERRAQGAGGRGQKKAKAKAPWPRKPPAAEPSKNRKRLIADLERRIEAAEADLASVEDELADPAAWASPTATERSSKRHAAAKRRVDELYAELETAGA